MIKFITPIALLAAALLSACSSTAPAPDQEVTAAADKIAALRAEHAPVEEEFPELQPIFIPQAELWLEDRLVARYENITARAAFIAIIQNRPVRFNFEPAFGLRVVHPLAAESIREHLDSVAAQADWSYVVEAGVVQVYDIQTKSFVLKSAPGKVAADMGLRNLMGTGGSSADNTLELTLDPYAGPVVEAVHTVLELGVEGVDPRTSVALLPDANLLVVKATPNAMRQVEDLIDRYNARVSTVVQISLSLIEVEFEDEANHELLLQLIRRSSKVPLALSLGAAGGALTLGPAEAAGLDIIAGKSRLADSSLIYDWLDTFGNTTLSYDDTIEAVSNQIASVDVTRTEQYVSKISLEGVGDGATAATPEVEFSDLRTGLVMHLQPTVDGDQITLRMGLSRSALAGRTPYEFGGVSGTNFITDDFNRVLSVSLTDGVPKLLASFSETARHDQRSQIPWLGRFGAGQDKSARSKETVMMITATVLGR